MKNAVPPALRVVIPRGREAARRFVVDLVLGEWLGQDLVIALGDTPEVVMTRPHLGDGRRIIMPDVLLGTPADAWLTSGSLPSTPFADLAPGTTLGTLGQERIRAVFADPTADGYAVRAEEGAIRLLVDVLGSVFYLVTRYEELVGGERDRHDRFLAASSATVRQGLLQRPIVDEYLDLLWSVLHAQWPDLIRPPAAFRLRPTHDVDQPWAVLDKHPGAVLRSAVKDVLIRHDPRLAWSRLRALSARGTGRWAHDPYDTFDLLMDAAEERGLRCTFYLLAGNRPGDPDFRYRIDDPWIAALLRRISQRGHEIGLHASYASHASVDRLRSELAALRSTCEALGIEQSEWGVRHHYLRFDARRSWRDYAEAGFAHDSTLGYAEAVGFRAGTGREYPVFDVVQDRPLPLRERPLVVMDVTLHEYLRLRPDLARARAEQVVSACRTTGPTPWSCTTTTPSLCSGSQQSIRGSLAPSARTDGHPPLYLLPRQRPVNLGWWLQIPRDIRPSGDPVLWRLGIAPLWLHVRSPIAEADDVHAQDEQHQAQQAPLLEDIAADHRIDQEV